MTVKDDAIAHREKRLAEALKANLRRRKAGASRSPVAGATDIGPETGGDTVNG